MALSLILLPKLGVGLLPATGFFGPAAGRLFPPIARFLQRGTWDEVEAHISLLCLESALKGHGATDGLPLEDDGAFLDPEKPGENPEPVASPAREPAGRLTFAFALETAFASESISDGLGASLPARLWAAQEVPGETLVAEDGAGLGGVLTREYFFLQVVALAWPDEKSREGCWLYLVLRAAWL